MTESINKAEIIADITTIIADMSETLDDESRQCDAHGIDFACMGYQTRTSLKQLVRKLQTCKLEDGTESTADEYRAGIRAAFDALCKASETLKTHMGDGEADVDSVYSLSQVIVAMVALLSLLLRA